MDDKTENQSQVLEYFCTTTNTEINPKD